MEGEVVYGLSRVLLNATAGNSSAILTLESHGDGVHSTAYHTILFLCVSLFIGCYTKVWLAKIPIPYTALLLIQGLLIGVSNAALAAEGPDKEGMGWLGFSMNQWIGVDPHLFLHVFLPALMFGSAFSMEWHIVQRCLSQALLLAGPGVLFATGLTAVFLKEGLPYNMDWVTSFMLGSVLSATDPVAVVALLKELGASKKLGTIIEGESLLNDGTAVVLFVLFKDTVTGEMPREGVDILWFALYMIAVSAVIGYAFGVFTGFLLSRVFNDEVVEICITFVSTYLCFYLAELAQCSGVLATVVFGLYCSAVGKSQISAEVEVPLHKFWSTVEYAANTIIFVFSGVLIGSQFFMNLSEQTLGWSDLGYSVALYLVLTLVRTLMIFIFFPILQGTGYGLDWKEAVVMTWGGLRGAIGLALALIVNQSHFDPDRSSVQTVEDEILLKDRILFQTFLIVVYTLLINGSTTALILDALGMNEPDDVKATHLRNLQVRVNEYGSKHYQRLLHDPLLGPADWPAVQEYTGLTEEDVRAFNEKSSSGGTDSVHSKSVHPSNGGSVDFHHDSHAHDTQNDLLKVSRTIKKGFVVQNLKETIDRALSARLMGSTEEQIKTIHEARLRVLSTMKASFVAGFEKGYITPVVFLDLKECVDINEDYLERPLFAFALISSWNEIPQWLKWVKETVDWVPIIRVYINWLIFAYLQCGVIAASAFVYASMVVSKERESFGIEAWAVEYAVREVADQRRAAEAYIRSVRASFPEAVLAIRTSQVANAILQHKRNFVDDMNHRGLAEERDVKVLYEQINGLRKYLSFHPPHLDLPDPREILSNTRLLAHATDEGRREKIVSAIASCAVEHIFAPGEDLFTLGEPSSDIFIIGRGFTAPLFPKRAHKTHSFLVDEVVGEFECMLSRPRLCSMRALTIVTAFSVDRSNLVRLVDEFPELGVALWQACGVFAALTFQLPYFSRLAMAEKMRVLFSHARPELIGVGEELVIQPGSSAFLFSGGVRVESLDETPGPQDGHKRVLRARERWKSAEAVLHDEDVRHALLRGAGPINFFGREVNWIDSSSEHVVGQVLDKITLCLPGVYKAVDVGKSTGSHAPGQLETDTLGAFVLVIPPWSPEIRGEYMKDLLSKLGPMLKMNSSKHAAVRWKRKVDDKRVGSNRGGQVAPQEKPESALWVPDDDETVEEKGVDSTPE